MQVLRIIKSTQLCSQVIKINLSSGGSLLHRFYGTTHTLSSSRQDTIRFVEDSIKRIGIFDEIFLPPAQLDWPYLLDPSNVARIEANIKNRKSNSDIQSLQKLFGEIEEKYNDTAFRSTPENEFIVQKMVEKLYVKATELPNTTFKETPVGDYEKCENVLTVGEKLTKRTPTIDRIAEFFGWLKEDQLTLYSTQRGYILKKELADLENALIRYTLDFLNSNGFILTSVPDILHHLIIESCGFSTRGERTQVYKLDYLNEYGRYCLSGTSEMALAGLLKNRLFNESELPLKFCASSRCYRAEVSGSEREGRMYRLHEFTKVEMFVISPDNQAASNSILEDLKSYQISLFSDLGFHFRVLNMSTEELGAPAYRKYDIEAWLPGNEFYGEISSTSNCIDYQSRRLNIKSTTNKLDATSPNNFVHTLNGTACAIPRMLTAIVESNWDMEKKQLRIPEKLRPYMDNKSVIQVPADFKQTKTLHAFK